MTNHQEAHSATPSHDFRRPFGEGNAPSASEVELADRSFRRLLEYEFSIHPETSVVVHDSEQVTVLDLIISEEKGSGLKVRLHEQTFLDTGDYIGGAGVWKAGETDEEWGPKICDYFINGSEVGVRRLDHDGGMPPVELDDEAVKNMLANDALERDLGLNGHPIGVEEVNDLRALPASGVALHQKLD